MKSTKAKAIFKQIKLVSIIKIYILNTHSLQQTHIPIEIIKYKICIYILYI